MFLDNNANLPEIARKFSCVVFFGDPDRMLRQFSSLPRTLIFEKDAKKAGITIDVSQELVRLNTSLTASTPEKPNFLIIKNAELLNTNASNALLKTFEEARQHFVLLAHPRSPLLPTIISRSAIFYLPTTQTASRAATDIATYGVVEMANALDKKPDLALEVLNLLASNATRSVGMSHFTAIARAILSGNNPRLAFLSYL